MEYFVVVFFRVSILLSDAHKYIILENSKYEKKRRQRPGRKKTQIDLIITVLINTKLSFGSKLGSKDFEIDKIEKKPPTK